MTDDAPTTYLYRLYAQDGTLLYVGISRNLRLRRQSHVADKEWWYDVARWRIVGPFRSREAAAEAERKAIRVEHPLYNVRGVDVQARRSMAPLALARRDIPRQEQYETAAQMTGVPARTLRATFRRGEITSLTRNGLLLWIESLPRTPVRTPA